MPPKKIKETVNWIFEGKEDFSVPVNAIGFVYRIDLLDGSGIYYYGKKNLTSTRGRGKKSVTKESNWRKYNSSSKELVALIKKGTPYKKAIIEFCFSKAELTLKETMAIICNNCLTDIKSLNKWVYCRIYQHQLLK